MADTPDQPASSGAQSSSSGGAKAGGGSAQGGSGSRNRNRNRNRGSGSGSGSGGGNRSGNGAGGSGGGGAKASSGGGNNAGGRSGSKGGGSQSSARSGSRNNGGSRGSSGNRRPSGSGSGSGRSNQGGGSRSGSGQQRNRGPVEAPAVVATAPPVERSAESVEEASAIRSNRKRAIRLCLVPGLVVGVVVGAIVALAGVAVYLAALIFVVIAVGLMLSLWLRSPGAVLSALRTVPMGEWEHPRLQNLVDGLCATMGLPRPAICVVDSPVPNAMALGRDPQHAVLIVTSGLDERLNLVELEGVLAHELSHIKRHDTVLAGVAVVATAPWASLVGVTKAAERVHHLVGKGREFAADQRAAAVVRYPPGIASALDVMAQGTDGLTSWPPTAGRTAALTRWLWIDPMVAAPPGESVEGNLNDTRVRAQAQSMR